MTSYAIIGASRGIGLEYVRQLAARSDSTVLAVVRNAAKSTHLQAAIKGLKNVHVLEADVTDYKSLEQAAKEASEITGGTLDVLIHNAAFTDMSAVFKGYDHFGSMDELDADLLTAFKVNTLGMIHAVTAFLPLLRAGNTKKIVVISTGGAHVPTVHHLGAQDMAAYHITKASALMATTKWANKLKGEGFLVVSLAPGLVDTTGTIGEHGDPVARAAVLAAAEDFAKKGFPVVLETTEESVATQLKVIDGLKPSDNGLLLSHKTGKEYGL